MRAFRYRLYPTVAQEAALETTLRLTRELYNAALQERRDAYRSSDWAYTRTKCTWRNSYYQLNPSTGEYVVQSTKTVVNYSQPMLPGCPTPTD